jgi:hypothetical protein
MFNRQQAKTGILTVLFATFVLACFGQTDAESKPVFRIDLRQFGFLNDDGRGTRADYSGATFLSDSSLLVFVNQRVFHGRVVSPGIPDEPPAKFVLIDLASGKVLTTAQLSVLKSDDSVSAVGNDKFALLTASEVKLCSVDLRCHTGLRGSGPMFSSPSGRRLIVGGYTQTQQILLDSDGLTPIQNVGKPLLIDAIPGDSGIILRDRFSDHVKTKDGDVVLPLYDYGSWPSSRFISDSLVVGFNSDKKVAEVGTNCVVHYTLSLNGDPRRSSFVASAGRMRFAVNAAGYSGFKSSVDPFYQEGPPDFQRITVVDNETGSVIFRRDWRLGAFFTAPTLSPNGQTLAVIHDGMLDVFSLR